MFDAWYNRICKTWPTARLLATDTDRYLLQVFSGKDKIYTNAGFEPVHAFADT